MDEEVVVSAGDEAVEDSEAAEVVVEAVSEAEVAEEEGGVAGAATNHNKTQQAFTYRTRQCSSGG